MKTNIPKTESDLSVKWFNEILGNAGVLSGSKVVRVTITPLRSFGWTTEISKCILQYDSNNKGLPRSLIVKCSPSSKKVKTYFSENYSREVFFYKTIGPKVQNLIPKCYFAEINLVDSTHVLVLEDLTYLSSGNTIIGSNEGELMDFASNIAKFHSLWWENPALDTISSEMAVPKIHISRKFCDKYSRGIGLIKPFFNKKTISGIMDFLDRAQGHWEDLWSPPRTIIQWDAHASNCMFRTHNKIGFALVDWQYCTIGCGIWDLARYCTLSLSIDLRRSIESKIIDHYVRALTDNEIDGLSLSQCFFDFKIASALQLFQQVRLYSEVPMMKRLVIPWVNAVAPRVVGAFDDAISFLENI